MFTSSAYNGLPISNKLVIASFTGIGPNQLPLQPGLYPQVNVQDPSAPFPSAPPSYDQATALPQKS